MWEKYDFCFKIMDKLLKQRMYTIQMEISKSNIVIKY